MEAAFVLSLPSEYDLSAQGPLVPILPAFPDPGLDVPRDADPRLAAPRDAFVMAEIPNKSGKNIKAVSRGVQLWT